MASRENYLSFSFTPKAKWIYNFSKLTLIKDKKIDTLTQNKPPQSTINLKTNLSSTFSIEHFRNHKGGYIVKFKDCNDRSEAEKWHGAFVSVPISSFYQSSRRRNLPYRA